MTTTSSSLNTSSIQATGMQKASASKQQQRNRTQLISPNNFQTATGSDMAASFMINPGSTTGGGAMAPNKGFGTFVPEMGGFTTTTAKDVGKRIFNFTQQ